MVPTSDLHTNEHRLSGPGQSGTSPEAIPCNGGDDTIIVTIMFTGQRLEVIFNHFHFSAAVGRDVCLPSEVFVWPRTSAVDFLTSLSAPCGKH